MTCELSSPARVAATSGKLIPKRESSVERDWAYLYMYMHVYVHVHVHEPKEREQRGEGLGVREGKGRLLDFERLPIAAQAIGQESKDTCDDGRFRRRKATCPPPLVQAVHQSCEQSAHRIEAPAERAELGITHTANDVEWLLWVSLVAGMEAAKGPVIPRTLRGRRQRRPRHPTPEGRQRVAHRGGRRWSIECHAVAVVERQRTQAATQVDLGCELVARVVRNATQLLQADGVKQRELVRQQGEEATSIVAASAEIAAAAIAARGSENRCP